MPRKVPEMPLGGRRRVFMVGLPRESHDLLRAYSFEYGLTVASVCRRIMAAAAVMGLEYRAHPHIPRGTERNQSTFEFPAEVYAWCSATALAQHRPMVVLIDETIRLFHARPEEEQNAVLGRQTLDKM